MPHLQRKGLLGKRKTSTPPASPEKEKLKVSAIQTTLGKSPKGLSRFLKKCTPVEYKEQVQRATEEENEQDEDKMEKSTATKVYCTERRQEVDKLRQQRHRQKMYDTEISLGERSPGGTKQNLKVLYYHLMFKVT
jgi:hypothetical protein